MDAMEVPDVSKLIAKAVEETIAGDHEIEATIVGREWLATWLLDTAAEWSQLGMDVSALIDGAVELRKWTPPEILEDADQRAAGRTK